jgi:hypothetical protein
MTNAKRSSVWVSALRGLLLGTSILWVACGSDAGARGPLRVCETYAAAYDACFSSIGDRETVSRQVEAMRRTFAARAATPSTRSQLAQACSEGLERLQRTCVANSAGLHSSAQEVAEGWQ